MLEIALLGMPRCDGLSAATLRDWLGDLVRSVAPDASSLGVRFLGDRAMREMNLRFRAIDKTTDVLSFPGDETPDGRHLGDIVVCAPTAQRQADKRGYSCEREIRLLLLHGVLHCLGMDHEHDDGAMEALEHELRERWL